MRAAIVTVGSRGDVHPYVALGIGLRSAGHDVTVATHERFAPLVEAHGLRFAPLAEGELSRGRSTAAGERWIEQRSRWVPSWVGLLEDAASVATLRLAQAREATRDADVVVASLLGTILGLQVAEEHGIALVRSHYAPLGRLAHPVARRALWWSSRPMVNRARRAQGLPAMGWAEPFGPLDRAGVPLLLACSPSLVPPEVADHPWVHLTGTWELPAEPASTWTPPPELEAFLAAGRAPVLVSFGAMADRDPAGTVDLVVAALAQAGQRGVLVLDGDAPDPGPLPPHVLATRFVPFGWLLPRLAAAVHHGGAGTTALCLQAGLPSVVVPAFADQPYWAGRVAALGVGPPPIRRRDLTVERLAEAVERAANDPGMRARAAEVGRALQAEDGVARAVVLVEQAVEDTAARRPAAPPARAPLATRPRPGCPVCGSPGRPLHQSVADRLFDVPGAYDYVQCADATCATVWMDPVVVDDALPDAYRTYYTHAEASAPPRLRPLLGLLRRVRRHRLAGGRGVGERLLLPVLDAGLRLVPGGRDALDDTACHLGAPPRPGGRLLELGFGNGQQLARMQALGWVVTGVDTDAAAVAAARERGFDARVGTLQEQRFDDGAFDAVYLSHVLEHVPDPVGLLAECRRVLAPGGRLVVITPNAASRGHGTFGAAWFNLEPPRHLVLCSPASLRAALRRAGFTSAEVRTSARMTFITWIGSTDIRAGGRVRSFDGERVPLGRLARGLGAQVVASAALALDPDSGEEILALAVSPAATGPACRSPEDVPSLRGSSAPRPAATGRRAGPA